MSVRRRSGAGVAVRSVTARRGDGGVRVSEVQRSRMLSSAAQVISEHGYGKMSVARVTGRARVSRRTFYDVFEDREDCFLAVFNAAVSQAADVVVPAFAGERGGWCDRVRAGLLAFLVFLDREPEVCSLLVVDALGAGPKVLERRAEVLGCVSGVLDEGGSTRAKSARTVPVLTGEGVVGAVFSVIHTRLLARRPAPLVELLGPLMGMIVLPYLGPTAAQREVERPTPKLPRAVSSGARRPVSANVSSSSVTADPLEGLSMRLTYRTLRVLSVVAECPGASNREVGDAAGASDQGQISKLLARLVRLGLIENRGVGHAKGEPNVWFLTVRGGEVERVTRVPVGGQ